MPIVAIVGETSPVLGRALVQALQQTSNTPIVLSLQSPDAPTVVHNAPVRQVDCDNHTSLVEALRGIHTVISMIRTTSAKDVGVQIALLRAAVAAGAKRFALLEFELESLSINRSQNNLLRVEVWAECEGSGLEVTRFCCGTFMDFLGIGVEPAEDKGREVTALAGLDEQSVIWDLAKGHAVEPIKDDGSSPMISLTDVWDVGRFVAAACELPLNEWDTCMGMVGETLPISEVTRLIGKLRGKEMTVRKVRRSDLQAKRHEEDADNYRDERIQGFPLVSKMAGQFAGRLELDGGEELEIVDPVLNRLFPDIRPKSVEQYLRQFRE